MKTTPVLLVILDGFGCRNEITGNAIALANKPNWDRLLRRCPYTTINASGVTVGLPAGQMGNSETGHLNIGAGRVVHQEFTRINRAIDSGAFFSNQTLLGAVNLAKGDDKVLHIMGLLSDGGVHSHENHIYALLEMAARAHVSNICLHAFLDGRDTLPRNAETFIECTERKFREFGVGRIATISGRYYGMDRNNNWERINLVYDMLTLGQAEFAATDATNALKNAYARGENDEFVKPTIIGKSVPIRDGDVIVFMNFRADRAREITQAFIEQEFNQFARKTVPSLGAFCTLTEYRQDFNVSVAFPPEKIHNGFGEYIAELGLKQLRIAETEKYAHVTFFFDGGEEHSYAGEERILIPSPDVATYDLKPAMSAFEITDKLVEAIKSHRYNAIICNYANADMVGHTGILSAAIQAIEVLDLCIARVVAAMDEMGAEMLITADHGNAEMMLDSLTGQPLTAHTTNPVPLVYVGKRKATLAESGALEDVAPTLLKMMGLMPPVEMTGHALIEFECASSAS